jgi:manganese catalase
MFIHNKHLQYTVRVDQPDPVFARQIQELIGGKYGEMTVMMQYLFQGWGLRGATEDVRLQRIQDMLLDTGTEEIAHVEMLAACVGMLLHGAGDQTAGSDGQFSDSVRAAMNPQHFIASGLGAMPTDSLGNPWNGAYATASGNIVADLYNNAQAEMNGRLQACRVYELTDDPGVRDMLKFMIARDHMHQVQWLAAIEELGGMQAVLPVPGSFPTEQENSRFALSFLGYSNDPDISSGAGRWANGPSPDGKGTFSYMPDPVALGGIPQLPSAPANLWNNLLDQGADGTGLLGGAKGMQAKSTPGKGDALSDDAPAGDQPSLLDRIGNAVTGQD